MHYMSNNIDSVTFFLQNVTWGMKNVFRHRKDTTTCNNVLCLLNITSINNQLLKSRYDGHYAEDNEMLCMIKAICKWENDTVLK